VGFAVSVAVLVWLALAAAGLRGLSERRDSRRLRGLARVCEQCLGGAALFFLAVRPFLFETVAIPGDSRSMRPTLHECDRVLASKLSTRFIRPARGDVVIFRAPPTAAAEMPERERFIKRVIGVPGDHIRADADGRLLLNGELLDEPYVAEPIRYLPFPSPSLGFHGLDVEDGDIVVPPGRLLVLGDNRNASFDSADWGYLDEDLVTGKAVLIVWPPARLGPVGGEDGALP
jgi:signal peptidase I